MESILSTTCMDHADCGPSLMCEFAGRKMRGPLGLARRTGAVAFGDKGVATNGTCNRCANARVPPARTRLRWPVVPYFEFWCKAPEHYTSRCCTDDVRWRPQGRQRTPTLTGRRSRAKTARRGCRWAPTAHHWARSGDATFLELRGGCSQPGVQMLHALAPSGEAGGDDEAWCMAECAERRECAGASWRPLSAAASNATDPRRLPLVQSPLTATDLTRDGLMCVLWRAMGPKGCALQPVAGDPRERAQTRKPNAAPDPWRHWRRSQGHGDGDGDSQAAQPEGGAVPVLLVGVGPAKSGSTLLFERVAASAGVRAAASGHGRLAPGAERHSGALRMPAGATACCGMETYFWADPCVASRGDSAAVYRLLHFDFEAPPQQPQPQLQPQLQPGPSSSSHTKH